VAVRRVSSLEFYNSLSGTTSLYMWNQHRRTYKPHLQLVNQCIPLGVLQLN